METYEIPFSELDLDREEILRGTGIARMSEPADVECQLDGLIRTAATLCHPRCAYVFFPAQPTAKGCIAANGVSFAAGPIIARYLEDADRLIFFIVTAGREFDRWAQEIKREGDILNEFLVDAVGSEIAEATVRTMSQRLERSLAEKGWTISNSYSPGYCGWPITDQQFLFGLFPPGVCGVELNASNLMLPVKSVSGVIAAGPHVRKMPYGCAICGKKDCYKNKLKKA